jgi:hypothetical protein
MEALFLYDPMNSLVTSDTGMSWLEKRQNYRSKKQAGGGSSGSSGDGEDEDPFFQIQEDD